MEVRAPVLVLRIRLLGDFGLTYGEQPVAGVDTPRLQALLAYLVLHRNAPSSRQHLAFLLWPDSSESQARTNLRNLLFHLRRALRGLAPQDQGLEFFRADATTVQWEPTAPYTLDVADMEHAIEQASGAERVGDRHALRAGLERAVALYGGDLMPRCYDDWILPERERLGQLFAGAASKLVEHLEGLREYPAAIQYAQRLLRHDELQEQVYRQLIRLHSLNGNRALALRVYHTCVTTLERELGTEPSAATRQFYESLVSHDAEVAPPPSLSAVLPLIGRHREWQQLQEAWRTAAQGHPTLVLIVGEAGIGKTRLSEELVAWAARQGTAVAGARSYSAEGTLAYAPVTSLLRSDALSPTLGKLDDVWLREVSRLVPETLAMRPHLEPPGPLSESWQRQRLFDALARAVLAQQPLLLALDDLQWCDRDTLEWLRYLLHLETKARLMVVGTYRPEEVDDDHPLRALEFALQRTGQLTPVELGPLDRTETAALADSLAGRALAPDVTMRLYRESEGSPLLIVEALRDSVDGEGGPAGLALARSPQSTAMIIQQRLARLSPPARELASLAAVIGREFTFPILAAVSRSDEAQLVRSLDELWRRRVVRERGADGYDFWHDRIRAAAYETLSAAQRRLLHRQVAAALEAAHGDALDAVSGQIAAHYEQAGSASQAARYYRRAGDVALRIYALVEAVAHYQHARELAPVAKLDSEELVHIYGELGRAWELDSQFERATAIYEEMMQLARQRKDRAMELDAVVRRITLQANPTRLHDPVAAREPAEQALALARELGNRAAEARILWALLHVYGFGNQIEQAIACGEQSLALAREMGLREQMAYALNDLGFRCYLMLGDTEHARDVLLQASELWRELDNRAMLADSLSGLCSACAHSGEYDLAIRYSGQAYEIARSIGNKWGQSYALYSMGTVYWERGHPGRAIATARECIALGEEAGFLGAQTATRAVLAWVYARLGAYDLALETARTGLAIAEGQQPTSRLGLLAHLARICLEREELGQARAAIEQGEGDPFGQARPNSARLLRLVSGELALRQGNANEALTMANRLLAERRWLSAVVMLDALTLSAGALRALGQDAQAREVLQEARLEAERQGSRRALWRILHALSQLPGDPSRAGELRQQAREIITYIADHIDAPELRRSFLAQPGIRAVL